MKRPHTTLIYFLTNFCWARDLLLFLRSLSRISYQDKDLFSDKLKIRQSGKHLVFHPLYRRRVMASLSS
jgi:hypothetical protein